MRRLRVWPGTPAPVGLPEQPWQVEVTGPPAEGREWTREELAELRERYGWDSEEYLDATGPVPGYQATFAYGPYTRSQAERLAEWLKRPEVATREGVRGATAIPLPRYTPRGRYAGKDGEA